jgi:hypothetical protein
MYVPERRTAAAREKPDSGGEGETMALLGDSMCTHQHAAVPIPRLASI